MNKDQLIREVASRTDMSNRAVSDVISATLQTISDTMAGGEKVAISGFGSFEPHKRAARIARAPKTGNPVEVPETVAPVFRAGKVLKANVAKAKI